MKKDLTAISDLTRDDIEALLDSAFRYRELHQRGIRRENSLEGRVVAMVFEKPSLRTKVSFEVAAAYLGAMPVFLTSEQILASGQHEQGRESVVDIARNLERMADLLIARVYHHSTITTMAHAVRVPVINALCDQHHPAQALADLMTMRWHKERLEGLQVAFVGDGNNVATSLMQACAVMGVHFRIAAPRGYEIGEAEIAWAKAHAYRGAQIEVGCSPGDVVKGADVVYTDTFISMGQEREKAKRVKDFEGYQVTAELMARAKPDAIFMHCLPAHRGEEVTDAVMDSAQSKVFDQAECRLHVAKAILRTYLHG